MRVSSNPGRPGIIKIGDEDIRVQGFNEPECFATVGGLPDESQFRNPLEQRAQSFRAQFGGRPPGLRVMGTTPSLRTETQLGEAPAIGSEAVMRTPARGAA